MTKQQIMKDRMPYLSRAMISRILKFQTWKKLFTMQNRNLKIR